ncbi:DHHC palmitoyltransferase-domain-containing protein [Halteromyces radiatus]|uniref:DHHC palmitoyltransferase-domain-containing protein n=1 Tax=Halteromyces radiatus TaxID=101107 RepID=UPI00221FC2F5|nr:DHHC palmitoyltransferase-domain-containing protein [Halteromyces radiatus]KAI8097379.1 DHHC palmitoyltransferase-domain-containing protein [Halteromyces radiatus]
MSKHDPPSSSLKQSPDNIQHRSVSNIQMISPRCSHQCSNSFRRGRGSNNLTPRYRQQSRSDELQGSFENMDLDRLPTVTDDTNNSNDNNSNNNNNNSNNSNNNNDNDNDNDNNNNDNNNNNNDNNNTNDLNNVITTSALDTLHKNNIIDSSSNNNVDIAPHSSSSKPKVLHPSLERIFVNSSPATNPTTTPTSSSSLYPVFSTQHYANQTIPQEQQQQQTYSATTSSSSASYSSTSRPLPSTTPTGRRPSRQRLGIRTLSIRNYERFPGNNVFFFHGRFLTSRVFWAFALAVFLLIAPSILFAIFICPWLWYQIHPIVPILFGYMFLLSLASMVKTSWTDPGILPRHLHGTLSISQDNFGHAYELHGEAPPPLKQVTIKGEQVHLKYCDTCGIYRPPRASHCRQCNNCVENEDHHCIWLNNCVGKRNYRSFFTFIVTSTVLCLYVIGFGLVQLISMFLVSNDRSFKMILTNAPVSFLLVIFCFLLVIPVGSLTGYHCFLTMRGVTTHEQLRSSMAMRPLEPHLFDFGNPLVNFIYALCRPRTKSYLARRKYVQEQYNMDQAQVGPVLNTNQPTTSSTTAVVTPA